MNIESHLVLVDGKEVILTFKEFELLKYMLKNIGIVLSRDKLLKKYGDMIMKEKLEQ